MRQWESETISCAISVSFSFRTSLTDEWHECNDFSTWNFYWLWENDVFVFMMDLTWENCEIVSERVMLENARRMSVPVCTVYSVHRHWHECDFCRFFFLVFLLPISIQQQIGMFNIWTRRRRPKTKSERKPKKKWLFAEFCLNAPQ